MRDLNELRLMVRDKNSRVHFDESIKAFQAGAFRAAIVQAWVAVALDLIDKLRYLSSRDDAQAKEFISKLDTFIKNNNKKKLQELENSLLETSKSLELINSREFQELSRLYQDRNACAHPAFVSPEEVFQPSAEQVRAHLASAADNALSLPPVSGREVQEQLLIELQGQTWPGFRDSANYIETRFLNNTRETVQRGIVELLIKCSIGPLKLSNDAEVSSDRVAARSRTAVCSIGDSHSILLNTSIENVIHKWERSEGINNKQLLRIIGSIGQFPITWKTLGDANEARALALLDSAPLEELKSNRAICSLPLASEKLNSAAHKRLHELLTTDGGLDFMIKTMTFGRKNLVQPAIESVKNAGSFRSAEEKLRNLLLLSSEIDSADIKKLGEAARGNNQVYLAADTQLILKNLCTDTKTVPGAPRAWIDLAQALNEDYKSRKSESSDERYSYEELIEHASKVSRELTAPSMS